MRSHQHNSKDTQIEGLEAKFDAIEAFEELRELSAADLLQIRQRSELHSREAGFVAVLLYYLCL